MLTALSIIMCILIMWALCAMIIVTIPAAILLWSVLFEKNGEVLKKKVEAYAKKRKFSGKIALVLVYAQYALNKKQRGFTIPIIGILIVGIVVFFSCVWNKMGWTLFLICLGIEFLSIFFLIRYFKKQKFN